MKYRLFFLADILRLRKITGGERNKSISYSNSHYMVAFKFDSYGRTRNIKDKGMEGVTAMLEKILIILLAIYTISGGMFLFVLLIDIFKLFRNS